jgi:cellulose synthase/poly-beta-1,6-N-acetylglucosamine synthase-like glycosyltransferase
MSFPKVRNWKPSDQDREHLPLAPWKKAVVLLGVLYSAGYYAWRATSTLNPEHPAYSWFFWACEVLGFASSLVFVYSSWRLRRRVSPAIKSNPTVDVMITTFNEGPEILVSAIHHAVAMDYPHKTYVLDDGRRPEIEKLAREMGAEYLTREDNKHAKAGNMNAALKKTRGDLVVNFDADGVPRRDFLLKTLGYFEDPQVALVQTPQTFYNLDSFQHLNHASEDQLWNEQSLFFDRIQAGRDSCEAAMCCGSGSVLRRSALEKIGGISTGTLVEDLHTSFNLHVAGYKSVYHAEPISYCLAPSSVGPYVVQRARWALGAIQILRKTAHQLFGPSPLTISQRIGYLSTLYYVAAIQRATYYVAPLLFVVWGLAPIDAPNWFVLPFTLNLASSIANYYILSRGRARLIMTEVFYMYVVWDYLKANVLGWLPINFKFRVTSKSPISRLPIIQLWPPVLITLIAIVSFSTALEQILETDFMANGVEPRMGLTLCFSWVYLVLGILALVVARKRPLFQDSYSFLDYRPLQIREVNGKGTPELAPGIAVAISDRSLRFIHLQGLRAGTRASILLDLPGHELELHCEVTRCHPVITQGQSPFFQIDLDYVKLPQEAKMVLMKYFFEDAAPRVMARGDTDRQLEEGPRKGPELRKTERLPSLLPVFVREIGGKGEARIGLLVDLSEAGARIKFPGKLDAQCEVEVQIPWTESVVKGQVMRCVRESGQVNPPHDIGIRFHQNIQLTPIQRSSVEAVKAALPEHYQAA